MSSALVSFPEYGKNEMEIDLIYKDFYKDDVWISNKFYGNLIHKLFLGIYIDENETTIKAQICGHFEGRFSMVLSRGRFIELDHLSGPIGKLP